MNFSASLVVQCIKVCPRPILRTCTVSQLLIGQLFLDIMTGFLLSLDLKADIVG